ncbi:MAG: hydantoinase/oxoprolinase family protein [Alphaproteobacteria bacterium]|nr:hydantoinase/oxoprolinase family protein [Alphaproteobacteria bacterium]
MRAARIGVDIGGTFTDFVLEHGSAQICLKLLTTPEAPERAVIAGVARLLAETGTAAADVAMVVHGTTLATNAVIERRGAKVGFVTTEGFRDTLEMAYEHRYDQYDLLVDKPRPLVPRRLRVTVRERIAADGRVLTPLDHAGLADVAAVLREEAVEAVAVGFLHAYANPAHERAAGAFLRVALPGVPITLSSDISPEIREYERFTTAVANAYVQPLMATYLARLDDALRKLGIAGPLLLMQSNGGLCDVATTRAAPVRLMESGPAGGAIFAAAFAAELGLDCAMLLDIGGTTAKLCFLDDFRPGAARSLEVARLDRFKPGSGLPLRLPVIELCEIGAGGGSLAAVDRLGRITVGPRSAGSVPGPACYALGGTSPTVTDANLALGRLDAARFADGAFALQPGAAAVALQRDVGAPLGIDATEAAIGVIEVVNENMARAAREHAIDAGRSLAGRTMIAIGGAAALHAADLVARLGMVAAIVPSAASVGSAVGFLRAPIAFEKTWSHHQLLSRFDAVRAGDTLLRLIADATASLAVAGEAGAPVQRVTAQMRYRGQGGEFTVPLGPDHLDAVSLRAAFEAVYQALFRRVLEGDVELLGFTVRLEHPSPPGVATSISAAPRPAAPWRFVDQRSGMAVEAMRLDRAALPAGDVVAGPAIIVDAGTTIVVPAGFTAAALPGGHIRLEAAP